MRSSPTVEATGSRPAVGSSYMMSCSELVSRTSLTTALARATRFFMPPDSSDGYRPSTPGRPTLARLSATKVLIWASGRLECSYKRNPTFSPTVSESKSAAF
mmetsp:Transcript_106/g.183  ORF Transcript_106/g.183 Transcript_106/m.183 type:complete len:102 (+) Transcript_106:2-307(+)